MNPNDNLKKLLEPRATARAAVLLTDTVIEFLDRIECSLPADQRLAVANELNTARATLRKAQCSLSFWAEDSCDTTPLPAAYYTQIMTNCCIALELTEVLAKIVAGSGTLPVVMTWGETFWDAVYSLSDLAKKVRTMKQSTVRSQLWSKNSTASPG
ncbi:MAG: hypothetical protein ACUVWX_14750 [Kiritimatiellia bacterium]